MKELTKRQRLDIFAAQLFAERASFEPIWRDCAEYALPRRIRLSSTDVNRGDRRNHKILDGTATMAARTLRAGLMGGITSPARPWFKLGAPDPELEKFGPVKEWLYQTERIMSASFLKSNIYNTLPLLYGDLGTFGTGAIGILEEFTGNLMHSKSFPVGSYAISKDEMDKVNGFVRDFSMTVRQLVNKFGIKDPQTGKIKDYSNFSSYVMNAIEKGQTEQWVQVRHVIEQNPGYNPDALESKFMKYSECYYERSSNTGGQYAPSQPDHEKYLEESGYEYFPVLAPRWECAGEDIYATSWPMLDAIGDTKQLQLGEKRIFEAVEKQLRPPMIAPVSMQNKASTIIPGEVTYVDEREGTKGFRPAFEVRFEINPMEMKQQQCRQRIERALYTDLFLMLQNDERSGTTAYEIAERKEEKLLALGPVLEQLNQDLLDPLIDINFALQIRQRKLPPPPPELQGMPLKVEYVSIMAQAQKIIGIGGIDRFTSYYVNMAKVDPRAAKKVKPDRLIDIYAEMTSIPPEALRTDEEVMAMEQQEQQQMAQQQKLQALEQGASAAKNLSGASLDGNNALTGLLEQANAGNLVNQ